MVTEVLVGAYVKWPQIREAGVPTERLFGLPTSPDSLPAVGMSPSQIDGYTWTDARGATRSYGF